MTPPAPTTPPPILARCPVCAYPVAAPADPATAAADATARGAPPTQAPIACDRCFGSLRDHHGRPIQPKVGFAPISFLRGFFSLIDGCLFLFSRPEFAGKLRAPFLVNFVVVALAFFGMFYGLWSLFGWLTAGHWGWFEWMHASEGWLAGILAAALAAVTMFFVAPVLIETVTGPFLDPLADTTEKIEGGPHMRALDPGVWGGAVIGLRSSAQILAIQLILLPISLLISLSGIGVVIAVVLAAFLNAVVWFDIPAARRGIGLRGRLRLIRRNWAAALGFGLAFQAGLLIPIFNFLMLTPAAAVATSRLFLRFDRSVLPAPANRILHEPPGSAR